MTVSNVISPLMFYVDRLVIGAMVSVVAVAYYATPFEVVSRLLHHSERSRRVCPAFTMSFAQDIDAQHSCCCAARNTCSSSAPDHPRNRDHGQ